MSRQVYRVPLDFDWPLGKVWPGFINPHYEECPDPGCHAGYLDGRRDSVSAALTAIRRGQLEPGPELCQMGWTADRLDTLRLVSLRASEIPIDKLVTAFFGETDYRQDPSFPIEYLEQVALSQIRDQLRWCAGSWTTSRVAFPEDWYTFTARDRLVKKYAWAIPNKAALDVLAAFSPIVELGAGMGYWAYLLRKLGVDIVAFDENPPQLEIGSNIWCDPTEPWTPVFYGDAHELADHYPERTLFICWPPMGSFCASAVARYRAAGGRRLIYIGEDGGGCTGSFDETAWRLVQTVRIPQWYGLHDEMRVLEAR